jgi:hypothetical protein
VGNYDEIALPDGAGTVEKPKLLVGTGMPAALILDVWAGLFRDVYGVVPYQVGSSVHGKQWRDIDIRGMLWPTDWARILCDVDPDRPAVWSHHPQWVASCLQVATWASTFTGLPVDFQWQTADYANEKYPGYRVPLGILFEART